VTDKNGESLLHLVTKNAEMTRNLLSLGVVDVNATDFNGQTPLHKAARAGNMEVVAMLLAQPGVNGNAFVENSGTPLHYAIANGHEDVAIKLIECRAMDINLRDHHCSPAFFLALRETAMKCVRALCARPDLMLAGNCATKSATPLLLVAASFRNSEALELLIAHPRMRLNDPAYGRRRALKIALRNGYSECAHLLKKK
jgi:ankyrin repeat protein